MSSHSALVIVALAALSSAGNLQAQDYPVKPIRLIVLFAAGGNADIVARIYGQARQRQNENSEII